MNEPNATGQIDVQAPAEQVYALVSDPAALAELAEEYSTFRWLGGATAALPGARFRGGNRQGSRRWSTIATITDADPGKRFAFDVHFARLPISRWQYDIEPAEGGGCRVTESTWEKRPGRRSRLQVRSSTRTGRRRRCTLSEERARPI